jgi:hypothetical protein
MSALSIRQLWGRAWDLFERNWLLLLGLLILYIIVGLISAKLIPHIGNLIAALLLFLLWPVLVQAGYWVARQGQFSFREAFRGPGRLLMVVVYQLILVLILLLILGILIGLGYMLAQSSTTAKVAAPYPEVYMEGGSEAMGRVMAPYPEASTEGGSEAMGRVMAPYPEASTEGGSEAMSPVMAPYPEAYTKGGKGALSRFMALAGPRSTLVVAGSIITLLILFVVNLFFWAGPYAILSGRAGVFRAIGQSFSLTARNFGKVLLASLSLIVLGILGAIPCGLGLLAVSLMSYVFWPLLYLALTGEEGVSHS